MLHQASCSGQRGIEGQCGTSLPVEININRRKEGQFMNIADILGNLDLVTPMSNFVEAAGTQVTDLLPVGLILLFVLAIPRVVRRIVNTFL